jgi:iron complex transport system substrate-binding protein
MIRTLAAIVILLVIFVPAVSPAPAFGAAPARIVSLAPNITEILYDLGLGDRVVAVTDFCDYPPAVKSKPRVGGFTNPSLEAIVGAKPDLVILTDDGNPKAIYNRLRDLGVPCHVFTARRLKELPRGIRELGVALGAEKEASALASRIEKDMAALEKKARQRRAQPPKSALFIIQPEPIVVAGPGTLIHEAFGILGIRNAAADGTDKYPKFSLEEIIHRSPDFILAGQGFMSGGGIERLKERLHMLPAVKQGRVCVVSERLYRLSPRAVAGIEEVARCAAGF